MVEAQNENEKLLDELQKIKSKGDHKDLRQSSVSIDYKIERYAVVNAHLQKSRL